MTVHQSKGLEADYTYIVGAHEGLFPMGGDHDEEARVANVALTRCVHAVRISWAREVPKALPWDDPACKPSRFFLDEPQFEHRRLEEKEQSREGIA